MDLVCFSDVYVRTVFFKKISVNEGIHIQKVEHVNYQL